MNLPGSGAVIHDITDVDAEMFLKGSTITTESASQGPGSPSNNISPYVVESPGPSASGADTIKDEEETKEPTTDLSQIATNFVTNETPNSRWIIFQYFLVLI